MTQQSSKDRARQPFAYLSKSFRRFDNLLNSKRAELTRNAKFTGAYRDLNKPENEWTLGDAPRETQGENSTRQARNINPSRYGRPRTVKRRGAGSGEEGKEWDLFAMLNRAPSAGPQKRHFFLRVGKPDRPVRRNPSEVVAEAPSRWRTPWQQTLSNCQENWGLLATHLQERMPKIAPDLPKLSEKARVRFTTLRGSVTPDGEVVVPAKDSLSLEEILKPFAGLSQLLQNNEMEDLARIINKAAEELEAMREDKLNDGRPLGPLQREALKRKREKMLRKSHSSLRAPGRHVAIYTTASLPWMTGTAVNPLLRAAYLSKDGNRKVTLVIPWLARADQIMIYPKNVTFETPEEQEAYVRNWVQQRTGMQPNFNIKFYPGRYATEKCSILPVGDPTAYIPDEEADVAVLEEPEHLNWYHHGRRWTDKFRHVVGIIHTNYLDYAMREEDGETKAKALALANQLVCRMHCHKVIKLSDAVQPLPRQTTAFVHGVPHAFIKVGEEKAKVPEDGSPRFEGGAYFIGKAIWAKGYTELLDLMNKHTKRGETRLHIDCYGSGEDLNEMKEYAKRNKLDMQFHGGRDHLDSSMHGYRVFVNPSTSDVVATTTAEALAMGKWVLVHDLPCNKFFSTFSNCLTYQTPQEFSKKLEYSLKHDPHPMREEERRRLTWEAATERFLDVAELKGEERASPVSAAIDTLAFNLHNYLTGVEPLRAATGAGVKTRDNPLRITDFEPSLSDSGGLFDDKKRAAARAAAAKAH